MTVIDLRQQEKLDSVWSRADLALAARQLRVVDPENRVPEIDERHNEARVRKPFPQPIPFALDDPTRAAALDV